MDPVLKRLGYPEFRPLHPFVSGWAQTIASHFWPRLPAPRPVDQHVISLSDGDQLVVMENRPTEWRAGGRIVLLVHGLSGCSQSGYVVRLARRLASAGYNAIRLNLRGCGAGFGLARQPYHSGRSEDTRRVLEWLARRYPDSPVTQIGFSLGGNITLKMAGEDGRAPSGHLDSVVAVSPPIDLAASARNMRDPKNLLFDRFFVRELLRDIDRHHRRFSDLPKPGLPKRPRRLTLTDFDDHYTAPRGGFASAADYYAKSSSGPLIPKIAAPSLILCAKDDPIIDARAFDALPARPGLDVVLTSHGGHVGFLGQADSPLDLRWMDGLILRWLQRTCA